MRARLATIDKHLSCRLELVFAATYKISLRHQHSRRAVLTFLTELKLIPLISWLSDECVFFRSLHSVMFCKKCRWPVWMSPWSQRSVLSHTTPRSPLSL